MELYSTSRSLRAAVNMPSVISIQEVPWEGTARCRIQCRFFPSGGYGRPLQVMCFVFTP